MEGNRYVWHLLLAKQPYLTPLARGSVIAVGSPVLPRPIRLERRFVPNTVKTEIIGHHARTLELPLLVRSAVSGEG